MMELHDTDGRGKIDFVEFLKMANSGKVRRNSHDEDNLQEVPEQLDLGIFSTDRGLAFRRLKRSTWTRAGKSAWRS